MIEHSLDSSDKLRSAKEEEEKLFNYKPVSLADRTLNLSKSWTSEPRQDPHLLLLWGLGWRVLIQVPTERIRQSWTKCLALTNKEPQFWIKVKLLRNCTALFFGGG